MATRRVFGVITSSDYKIEELKKSFSLYGIEVIKITSPFPYTTPLTLPPNTKLLGLIQEQTYLNKQNTKISASQTHLEPVEHLSVMTLTINDVMHTFKETTVGYIDLTKRQDTKKYDWDDIFVVASCHLSYLELARLNQKISSRDKNVSKIICQFIYYPKRLDLVHQPQHYTDTVDLTVSVSNYIESIPEFKVNSLMSNILTVAMNQGVFFRACKTRREKLYWCPGLNAGIPFTPKPKDRIHELTFQMHDFSHFNIPDLVFTGHPVFSSSGEKGSEKESSLKRKVYIAYRLISEAVTLVLADMIFVYQLIQSGGKYETMNQRRIYPIFQAIISDKTLDEKLLYELLKGSYEYCFYGDMSRWKSMMSDTNSTCLNEFKDKYDAYFMEDFRWTLHNYQDMERHSDSFREWWRNVKDWRGLGDNLELQTIDEFIEEMKSDGLEVELVENKSLIDGIFNTVYKRYIKRLWEEQPVSSEDSQLKNRYIRYLMGQSHIFFRYGYVEMSNVYFEKIGQAVSNFPITEDLIQNVRGFYNQYLDQLESLCFITGDDKTNYSQIYPLFSPLIVDYDHFNKDTAIEEFVKLILN